MASKRKRALAAARAAKRLPLVGTAVVILPIISAASDVGLGASTIGSMSTWHSFGRNLVTRFAGVDPDTGQFSGTNLIRTYGPIAAYLLARRFAGKHISRVLKPLGVRF